jgi:hypothetical protein
MAKFDMQQTVKGSTPPLPRGTWKCSIAIIWNNTWLILHGECSDIGVELDDFYKVFTNPVLSISWYIYQVNWVVWAFFLTPT